MLVHTIWIHDVSGGRTFGVGEWLSLMSLLRNTTYRVVLHTNLKQGDTPVYDPYKIQHDRFLINHRPYDMMVHGVRVRPANLSDMERIRLLYESGGIYADLDIWWLSDIDLTGYGQIVTAYENPSYKTVANAFIVSKTASWDPFLQLYRQMEDVFRQLAARGVTDLRDNPAVGLSKNHTLLWKLTGDFLKQHDVSILGRRQFYKNGWRRIGRELRRLGVTMNPVVDEALLGNTNDRLSFEGIVGFHYYAGLFTAEQLFMIPAVYDLFYDTLEWGQQFLVPAAD